MKPHGQTSTPPRASGRTVAASACRLVGTLLLATMALGVRPAGQVRAGGAGDSQAAGATVTYPAGWNLVAFPPGTDLSQISGPLYTYVSSEQRYEAVLPDQASLSGMGFWVDFTAPTTVVLGAGTTAASPGIGIIPGQWVLLGDPSGTAPAIIGGDAFAYAYDPINGYQPITSRLLPGKGVWVTLAGGSHTPITIAPSVQLANSLTSFSLISPCAAALATQGYTGDGTGAAAGDVDGQPMSVCFATGPSAALPAVQGFGCLLAGDELALLNGKAACGGMDQVVQEDATSFLWVSHLSAVAKLVVPLTWDGGGFQSDPSTAYTACAGDITLPVASAGECMR